MANLIRGVMAEALKRKREQYWWRVLTTRRSNLIAYCPLDETSGTTFRDLSGNGRSAAISGAVTPGGATFLDGRPAATLAGGYINLFSPSLAAAFTPAKFTFMAWLRVGSGSWPVSDQYFMGLGADSGNWIRQRIVNRAPSFIYRAQATSKSLNTPTMIGATKFSQFVLSVDVAGDAGTVYVDGEAIGTLTGMGAFQGTLTAANLGATDLGALLFAGDVAHVAIWDTNLSATEAKALYTYTTPVIDAMYIGDSKTQNLVWSRLLNQKLRDRGGTMWHCKPNNYGIGGYAVASMKEYIDANLASVTSTPSRILFNLGANDASANPTEATWKANLTSILDSLRAKWPGTPIYIAKVWARATAATCNTIDGWIDDVRATYPTGVYAGIDERVTVENGDNGVTYTDDGLHYNSAGHFAVASAWLALL